MEFCSYPYLFLDFLEEDGVFHDPGAWGVQKSPEFNFSGKIRVQASLHQNNTRDVILDDQHLPPLYM